MDTRELVPIGSAEFKVALKAQADRARNGVRQIEIMANGLPSTGDDLDNANLANCIRNAQQHFEDAAIALEMALKLVDAPRLHAVLPTPSMKGAA